MVTAGEKYADKFLWGEERFHTIKLDGKRFDLFETVKITTKDGNSVEGEIGYISEESVDILPRYEPDQTIKFENIESICH